MAVAETTLAEPALPAEADLGVHPERRGPPTTGRTVALSRLLAQDLDHQLEEYFYAWPDGREASGFRLEKGAYVPLEADAEGFFASRVLGARLRLVPAALEPDQ